MECSECGAELKPGQNFCGKCGIEIEWPEESEVKIDSVRADAGIEKVPTSSDKSIIFQGKEKVSKLDSRTLGNSKGVDWRRLFLIVLVLGVILILFGPYLFSSSNSEMKNNSQIATAGNSTSGTTGSGDTTRIPTKEIVDTFSLKLNMKVSQDDPTRGISFPEVSKNVDIWSAPYVTILIYSDSNSQQSDTVNFQRDFNNLNDGRAWESCLNVIAVFPNSLKDKVDSAVSTWCSSAITPSPTPTDITHSSSYSDGYSTIYGWQPYQLEPTGFTLYSDASGNLSRSQASAYCENVVTRIQGANNSMDGEDIPEWIKGCIDASLRITYRNGIVTHH